MDESTENEWYQTPRYHGTRIDTIDPKRHSVRGGINPPNPNPPKGVRVGLIPPPSLALQRAVRAWWDSGIDQAVSWYLDSQMFVRVFSFSTV